MTFGPQQFVALYKQIFNYSLHAETHLGPDGTKLKQKAHAKLKQAYAGQSVSGNVNR